MIIKRKYFTRQETKAMKEIYESLKKGNVGRNLSAKDFVKARHVSNETIDTLTGNGKVADFAKNEEIIEKLGLPETSKAYKRIVEKYSNPELHNRFRKIQQSSSNSRLRILRKTKNQLKSQLDNYKNIPGVKDYFKKAYDSALGSAKELKRERGASKRFKFNKNELRRIDGKEDDDIYNRLTNIKSLLGKENTNIDSEISQKIIKDLKKRGVSISHNPKQSTEYNKGKINFKDKSNRRDPSTILHEYGHLLSDKRKETRSSYYGGTKQLNDNINTSENLKNSINNRVKDLATLTEEANASYHAAAREKGYGITKEKSKANRKRLDNAFRTYELGRARNMLGDKHNRTLGKKRNK